MSDYIPPSLEPTKRYEIRVWIWDAHGNQRRHEGGPYVYDFDDKEAAISQATLRSFLANIALVEVYDHETKKVVKVFVKGRGQR